MTGLRKAMKLYQSGMDIQPLFVGKASIAFFDTLKEMFDRDLVSGPVHLPKAWDMNVENNPIMNYLLKSIIS